jgi:outer membrane immunogenic protein
MKKLLIAVALLGLGTGSSVAADLAARPYTKAPVIVNPAYDWTGFYIGATAGGAWSKADVSHTTVNGAIPLYLPGDIPGLDALGSPHLSGSNAIAGGKIGYNQQWGSFVAGLEGDISWFRFNQSALTTGNPFAPGFPSPPGVARFNTNASTTWLATIRPRVGVAVDRVLFYGTAGVAFANVRFSNTFFAFSPLGAGPSEDNEATAATQTRVGWIAGGGVDYAFAQNWIVSLEYLHLDLGSMGASGLVTSGNTGTATFNFSAKLHSDLVRAGISYKFGAPVVAKY